MRSLTLLLCVLSFSALAVAGCGSDETASSADSVVPAGAVMYGEVTLAPEGDQQKALDTLVAKFPGQGSLGDRIRGVLDDALAEADRPLSYENDVEPWLGDQAGFFLEGAGRDGELQSGAAMIATDDEDAAREALEKAVKGDSRAQLQRRGLPRLRFGRHGGRGGRRLPGARHRARAEGRDRHVRRRLAPGRRRHLRRGHRNIADERLGLLYLNSPKLFDAVQMGAGADQFESLGELFKEPYVTTMVAEQDGVVFEGDAPESLSKVVPFLGQGSDLIDELPGDSWLALAQPDLGKLLDFYVDAFGASVGGRDVVEDQLRTQRASTYSRTCSTGWATSACSCAAPAWPISTAASWWRPPIRRPPSVSSAGWDSSPARRTIPVRRSSRSRRRVADRASPSATTRCRSRSTCSCAATAS